MEEELDVKLFYRSTRRIVLTNKGLLLRRRAARILELVDKTEQELMEQDEMVPGKAYTTAVTQCKTKDVAAAAAEGAALMAIQTNDPRIMLVACGYPLFANGKIAGGIGVGGGTEAQDCAIGEYVVSVFEKLTC